MGYTVHFEGGSLGGTTSFQYGTFDGRDIHIPVIVPIRATAPRALPGPMSSYDSDVYRFMGERRGDNTYVYRWIRPDTAYLRDSVSQLKRELAECRKPVPRAGLMRFAR